jgi:endonuclease YncB( thermonuclease family)
VWRPIIALILLLSALPAVAETCRVVDGDTLRGGPEFQERVRLSGIDAPELFSPKCRDERRLAERARNRLEELVAGRELIIRREGRDRFKRTLATVYAGGTDVGAALAIEGVARCGKGGGSRGVSLRVVRRLDDD